MKHFHIFKKPSVSFLFFLKLILIIGTYCTSPKGSSQVYYIDSANGSDTNDGKTELSALQTLSKVNSLNLLPGDSVLFKKNNTYRGQLLPKSGSNSNIISYASYGIGTKPVIMGSLAMNATSDWVDEGGNIWRSVSTFETDIGNLIFNDDSTVGLKKWTEGDLLSQGDFWFDRGTSHLKIYSLGNPASVYSAIECALRKHVIDQQGISYVSYQDLALKYGAAHGIGGGNTSHITIEDMDISYIGGGDLNMDGSNIRFGNGIELWANSNNVIIQRCRIWEIYDTGITNQNHTSPSSQHHLYYYNNLVWNCGLASFEYWNRPSSSETYEVHVENNTFYNAGKGWGSQRTDLVGGHLVFFFNEASLSNFFIRNNVFMDANAIQISDYPLTGYDNMTIDYNLYYQSDASAPIAYYHSSGTPVASFDMDQVAAYQGASEKDVNSVFTDPLLIDPINSNFTIGNNSPAKDAGINNGLTEDFIMATRPIGLSIDIGAFEYQ